MAKTPRGLMLDTHYALPAQSTRHHDSGGASWAYRHFRGHDRKAAFAGMHDHAKLLPPKTLVRLLRVGGFARVDVAEERAERNGLRTLIYAFRD